jgi:phosphoglycerol transferase MdoB-like AlkP superfamily enzyme
MQPRVLAAAVRLKAHSLAASFCFLLCNRYTAFVLGVYLYSLVILLLDGLGGVLALTKNPALMLFPLGEDSGVILKKQYWELVLLFYLYCYGNMILRPSRLKPWLAALPLFLAYLGQDLYYLMYSNVFRFSELGEVPELLKVLTVPQLGLLMLVVVLPLGYFLVSIQYRRFVVLVVGALPIAALIAVAVLLPARYTAFYQKVGQPIEFWSDAVSAVNNGRFMMLLYREAERRIAYAKTESHRNRSEYEESARQMAAWIEKRSNQRNVHLVVLESFIDPTLFKKASYTRDPFHPDFRRLFGRKMGFSISPVFGGKTAQAEFEVLCGVPAFGEMTGVEFNNFTGAPAQCLPGILEKAGYQTMASNAYNPSFFNAPSAYKGLGFGAMYFPKEYSAANGTYLSRGDTAQEMGYMFDRPFFEQNLSYITPLLKAPNRKPMLNYLLTVYGHFPHLMNKEKRPLVLKMRSKFKDQFLEWAANQLYYRSQAVAEYVNSLVELDPDSLIILVSDHLPPGQYGRKSYQKLRYIDASEESMLMNRIMIIEAGKVKKLVTIHHYDVPALIMNSITDGAYCQEHNCGFTRNKLLDDRMDRYGDYLRVMAHASE